MKNKENILWIFLHIPKCAGSTFSYHLENNFKREEIIRLHTSESFNVKRNKLGYYEYNYKGTKKYLSALSKEQKDKVRVIYGHFVPYGIHKFFNKTPRYITFVRNPISRIISYYNFFRTKYLDGLLQKEKSLDYETHFLINGKVPTFEQWLKTKYPPMPQIASKTIRGFLRELDYMAKSIKKNNKKSLKKCLNKFYFVGITENYDEDVLFLYHELSINKFYRNQNISTKYFILKDYEKAKKMILSKSKLDQELYNCALVINKKFKENNKDFHRIVKYMKIKRILFLPLTYLSEFVYRISAKLKQRSISYSKFIDFIKDTKCKE